MNQQEEQQIRERLNGPETLDWTDTPRSTLIDRILDKIEVNPETGCWEWVAASARGYGKIRVDDSLLTAHRVTFRLAHGSLSSTDQLNHTCHRRSCVNTEHAYIGSQAENIQDAIEAGAFEDHSALRADDVRDIRERYASDEEETTVSLAEEYPVDQSTISNIVNQKTWTHID